MKYSWKGHKDRNRHKNRIKRSGQARLVYVCNINCNIPTTRRWARGHHRTRICVEENSTLKQWSPSLEEVDLRFWVHVDSVNGNLCWGEDKTLKQYPSFHEEMNCVRDTSISIWLCVSYMNEYVSLCQLYERVSVSWVIASYMNEYLCLEFVSVTWTGNLYLTLCQLHQGVYVIQFASITWMNICIWICVSYMKEYLCLSLCQLHEGVLCLSLCQLHERVICISLCVSYINEYL